MEVDVPNGNPGEGNLLVGQLVEVRKIGTRICWYPAKVVEAQAGIRVVEYETGEQETIVYGRHSGEASSSESSGRMRPRPPSCSTDLQKGLRVDAYGDSWREGVLMEAPGSFSTHVQVFFPDEGEKQQFCVDSVRVSQAWNEATNAWSLKGHETTELIGESENRFSKPQKTYQRKRKRKVDLDGIKATEDQETSECPTEEALCTKKRQKEKEKEKSEELVVPNVEVKQETCPSNGAEAIVAYEEPEIHMATDSGTDIGDIVKEDIDIEGLEGSEEKTGERIFHPDKDYGNTDDLCLTKTLPIPVCCINTQSEDALFVDEQRVSSPDQFARRALIKYEDAFLNVERPSYNAVDSSSQGSFHSSQDAALLNDEMNKTVALSVSRASKKKQRTPSAYHRRDDTLKEARRNAIKNLEDSGWKKGYRARQRENRISKEAYYIAPDGTSFHSLTSACNAWMQQNKDVSKAMRDAMRSYQLQIIVRRKYSCSDKPVLESSDMNEGVDAGAIKRKLRASRRQELKKAEGAENAKKGRPRTECRLNALLLAPARGKLDGTDEKTTKRTTIFSWLIDLGVVAEKDAVSYLNKDTQERAAGVVTRDGILCKCCNDVFSMPNFQIHAGNKVHRTATQIILEDGRSILDCQRQALKKLEDTKSEEPANGSVNMDESDECCGLCGEGGELICCDHCPATFHLHCILLKRLPEGDWFCPKCRCPCCGGSQFDGREVLYCIQCERSYHVDCLNDGGVSHSGNRFCSQTCHKIFSGLRGLVGITNPMDGGFTWTLLRSADLDDEADADTVAEHSTKLALALSVMKECFSPMIDPRRKIDIIAHILKNRTAGVRRLDFRGFYTFLLENKDELISVAAVRVHGTSIAEMPLIGTRLQYRRQGMCRRLMEVIEQVLRSLDVDTLVLPAVPELLETWIGAFGFQKVTPFQLVRLLELSIVGFPGTKVLQKPLTWLNMCRKIAPPLAERPWNPGSLLHMGIDPEPHRKPKQQKLSVSVKTEETPKEAPPKEVPIVQEASGQAQNLALIQAGKEEVPALKEDSTEDSRIVVAKTRSNRLVKASKRVAEALKTLTNKKFQRPDVEATVQSEESQEVENASELSFLKLGSSHIVIDHADIAPTASGSEMVEEGAPNDDFILQESSSGLGVPKELVELHRPSLLGSLGNEFFKREDQLLFSKMKCKKCEHCGTSETPMWRKGPVGNLYCNACGIRWKKSCLRPAE